MQYKNNHNLIPVIDYIGKKNYQITILNNAEIYSYHGVMYFPNYDSAFRYTKRYMRNIITLTKFFGVNIDQIKCNYRFS